MKKLMKIAKNLQLEPGSKKFSFFKSNDNSKKRNEKIQLEFKNVKH